MLKSIGLLALGVLRALAQSPDGLLHASETTTTTLTELVRREAYQAGVMYFAERPGVTGFVAKADITGQPTLTARFPIYDKLSAAAIAEASDFTTNSALDTSGTVDVTVSEHAQKYILTDLALGATVEDALNPSDAVQKRAIGESGVIGRVAAEALQRLQDQDITALFGALDSSTGSNSGPLTTTLLINGITQLNILNIPTDRRVAILHAKQWQALLPVFDDANDKLALGILQECFPRRKIIALRCNEVVAGLGAIHCVTQQEPATR